ncbi:DNA topoisomerase 3-alpha [Bienertia sinuspersici]
MESRRQHSFGSNSFSTYSRGVVLCTCGGPIVVRTVKNAPYIGRKFCGCPLWLVVVIFPLIATFELILICNC